VKRLHATFDHLHWMKLSEIARYWAARELTAIEYREATRTVALRAPFASEDFTLAIPGATGVPSVRVGEKRMTPTEVADRLRLKGGTWCREKETTIVCFPLTKGKSEIGFEA
jgi:hypothetical protein